MPGVLRIALPLVVVELARLVEDLVGDAKLADVVQSAARLRQRRCVGADPTLLRSGR